MLSSVTYVFGSIVCILGFLVVWLVYYFWKLQNSSDLDYHTSLKVHQVTGKGNRQHPRTDVNWPVSMETPDGTINAEIKNVSIGGAFVCCRKPLPIGEVFPLAIVGPNNEQVMATAIVVWSNVNVPEDKVVNRGMGVRFIKMSDAHIQLMRQICQESL